jgi:hypothetical protein
MSADSSSSGTSPVVPVEGGAPLSLEAILMQARSIASKRATVAQPQSPIAASSSAPGYAATEPASPSAAAADGAHNVGEKGSLKTRASLVAGAPASPTSDGPETDSQPLVRAPSSGKRQPKSDDRKKRSRTEMAVDAAVASDKNLSDDLHLHIVELKFFYQMSLVQVVAGLVTTALSIYIASSTCDAGFERERGVGRAVVLCSSEWAPDITSCFLPLQRAMHALSV